MKKFKKYSYYPKLSLQCRPEHINTSLSAIVVNTDDIVTVIPISINVGGQFIELCQMDLRNGMTLYINETFEHLSISLIF